MLARMPVQTPEVPQLGPRFRPFAKPRGAPERLSFDRFCTSAEDAGVLGRAARTLRAHIDRF
jgi:hypothetical protein